MSITDNFLLAEPLLIERLREQVPSAAFVGAATDMEQIDERSQRTPAVYVLFDGAQPTESAGQGRVQRLEQRWLIVGAIRNVSTQHDGSAAREDAGRLLSEILKAAQGFKPHPDLSALRLSASGQPEFNAGFMYIPTTWTTSATTRGI